MPSTLGHLQIEEVRLHPGQEHLAAAGSWRFVLVQCGAAYWLDGERNRPLAVGEMLVLGPKINGSIRASQINEVVVHTFNFQPDLLGGFFTLTERHYFDTAETGAFAAAEFLPSTHPAARRFADVIGGYEEPQSLRNRVASLGLVVSVFRNGLVRARPSVTRAISAQHRFQRLISQLPDSELIRFTSEQLAQRCGCSSRHFSRLFRQQFGVFVRARYTELRMLKARQLLENLNLPVAKVATESGYHSLSLFNSLFRKRFGMTPGEWRKQNEKPAALVSDQTRFGNPPEGSHPITP